MNNKTVNLEIQKIEKYVSTFEFEDGYMRNWYELRSTIKEMEANNQDKPEVASVLRFLLNLMDVHEYL